MVLACFLQLPVVKMSKLSTGEEQLIDTELAWRLRVFVVIIVHHAREAPNQQHEGQ